MSNNPAKAAVTGLALVATWATADAADFAVEIKSTTDLSNVRVYQQNDPSFLAVALGGASSSSQSLGSAFALNAGDTYTTTISTSYGTSTVDDPFTDFAAFSVVATTGTEGLVVGGTDGNTGSFGTNFPAPASQADVHAAVVSGSVSGVQPLFGNGNTLANTNWRLATYAGGSKLTGTLYGFDGSGAIGTVGTFSVAPVPEPASMAALGIGALGLMRRRRKLA